MSSNSHSTAKRDDIQSIRGIAIIGVLAFHLIPKFYVNGYIGVDIFFVLSGYLMSTILGRENKINGSVMCTFYGRRFKRIVPMYALMLAMLSVLTPIVFLPVDTVHFITDLEWALPLAENMENVMKKYDYWSEVFSSPVLLHAWSLGVEIQYYLIVPFIMIVHHFLKQKFWKLLWISGLMLGSYGIYVFSSAAVSFGLLFARAWQFLIGSLFYELSQKDTTQKLDFHQYQALSTDDKESLLEEGEKSVEEVIVVKTSSKFFDFLSIFLTVTLIVVVLLPIQIEKTTMRLTATFLTGVLLLIGKSHQNTVLKDRLLSYIGDLSYMIYLVHWPVIILFKYYTNTSDLTDIQIGKCVIGTLLMSVVLHHTLEQFYIISSVLTAVASTPSPSINLANPPQVSVAIVYTLILVAIFTNALQLLSQSTHVTKANYTEAIAWNARAMKVVYFNLPNEVKQDTVAETITGFKAEPQLRGIAYGNGTAEVLLIGNSYAYRAYPALLQVFAGRYKSFRLFSHSAVVLLSEYSQDTAWPGLVKYLVEKTQPDITFIIEKDSDSHLFDPLKGKVENDPVFRRAQNMIVSFCNNSGVVVLDAQYFRPKDGGVAYAIQKRLQTSEKANFNDLKASRTKIERIHAHETARMNAYTGGNLIKNRVEEQLCGSNDECLFYNPENLHAYYGDTSGHLTEEGLNRLKPGYKKIFEEFLRNLEGKNAKKTQ